MRAHGVSFVCTRDHLTLSNVGRRPELFEGQETPIARSCGLEGVVPKARRTILPSKTRCLSSKTALTIAAPRRYDASATTDRYREKSMPIDMPSYLENRRKFLANRQKFSLDELAKH